MHELCPICNEEAHPAMAKRYDGCCNDLILPRLSCQEIQKLREENERLKMYLSPLQKGHFCIFNGKSLDDPTSKAKWNDSCGEV